MNVLAGAPCRPIRVAVTVTMNNSLVSSLQCQPGGALSFGCVPVPLGIHPASSSLYHGIHGQSQTGRTNGAINQGMFGVASGGLIKQNVLQLSAVYQQAFQLQQQQQFIHDYSYSNSHLYHEDPEKRSKQELCQSIKKEILSQLGKCRESDEQSNSEETQESSPSSASSSPHTMSYHPHYYPKSRGVKRHSDVRHSPERKRTKSQEYDIEFHRPNLPMDTAYRAREVEQMTEEIWEYFESNRQDQAVYSRKMKLREALHSIFKGVFPYCGLYGVGSSMNGSGSTTSDLDLCLMVTQNQLDQKKEALELLKMIHTAMRKLTFIRDLKLIRAKVPILKFSDRISDCECDLNINNSVGIRNTHLINAYTKVDWRLSPLILFVKRWARVQDINDASKSTISSFSLVLMIIHYLQVGCNPPILPCLQMKYPHKFNANQDIRLLTLNEDIPVHTSGNQMTLGELFIGFLNYYTNVFNFEKHAISVRLARRVDRRFVVSSDINQWKCLCIEEPFDLSNTARSVYDPHVFERIKRVIRLSYRHLSMTGNLDSILNHPL